MIIGQPPSGLPADLVRYLTELATAINRLESRRPAKAPWDVTNITELRALDAAAGSASDVRSALATLVRDLINRGDLTGNRT